MFVDRSILVILPILIHILFYYFVNQKDNFAIRKNLLNISFSKICLLSLSLIILIDSFSYKFFVTGNYLYPIFFGEDLQYPTFWNFLKNK